MIYLLFKIIKLATRIGVSNLKDETEKATLAKFGNDVKDLIYDMSLNYSIVIDKEELNEDYVRHIFRDILSGPNSNLNYFIERTKNDWDTVTEVQTGELIHTATEKYNIMVAEK